RGRRWPRRPPPGAPGPARSNGPSCRPPWPDGARRPPPPRPLPPPRRRGSRRPGRWRWAGSGGGGARIYHVPVCPVGGGRPQASQHETTRQQRPNMSAEQAADIHPVLKVSDRAREMVLDVRASETDGERLALWLEISGVSGSNYSYDMYFESPADA